VIIDKQMNYSTKYPAFISIYDITQKTHDSKINKYGLELTIENYDA